ncbi:MAG: hypothetical protein K9J80_15760 [Sulfuritalea sp.]|nr:hypothetical protein [Sulfuritalea sp.]
MPKHKSLFQRMPNDRFGRSSRNTSGRLGEALQALTWKLASPNDDPDGSQPSNAATEPSAHWRASTSNHALRRIAIRSGEESVLRSTALLRSGFISADFLAMAARTVSWRHDKVPDAWMASGYFLRNSCHDAP